MAPFTLASVAFAVVHAQLDENSMLQMPMIAADECRCPGYYEAQCTAEAAQGCRWSSQGSSNGPWCQCLGEAVPVAITPVTLPPMTTLPPVTAPPATPSNGASMYIGCFVDDGARNLGAMQPGGASYTFATCRTQCAEHVFLSLQYGGECFCADEYSTAAPYVQVDESLCNVEREPCTSSSHNCGGTWHQAIYQIGTPAATTTTTTTTTTIASHTIFRLTVLSNYGSTTHFQFSAMNLFDQSTEQQGTELGTMVSFAGASAASVHPGSTRDCRSSEGPANAIDNSDAAKWCVELEANSAGQTLFGPAFYLEVTMPEAAIVNAIQFITGNDVHERDPKQFTLEGSNGNDMWDMLVDHSCSNADQETDRRETTDMYTTESAGC